MSTGRYNATIEYLSGQRAAIVTLTSLSGEWGGSGRIEVRSGRRSDLYEAGYVRACQSAAAKGGEVETYREVSTPKPVKFGEFSAGCKSRVQPPLEGRPGNALNLEIAQPMARCINSQPANWPAGRGYGLRWIASGFGACCVGNCPILAGGGK